MLCPRCDQHRPAKVKGLCDRCYLRAYRQRTARCRECGLNRQGLVRGLCRACHAASPDILKRTLRSLETSGFGWAGPMALRFKRHAVHNGYAACSAVPFVRLFARQVIESRQANPQAFAEHFAAKHRAEVLEGKRHVGQGRALMHFLEDSKLLSREDWTDVSAVGQTRTLIAKAPAPLRLDLERYHAHLEDERRYRAQTHESPRQRASERDLFAQLTCCARWLDTNGLTSWQELTPDRLRAVVRERNPRMPPRLVGGYVWTLRRFLEHLREERRIFKNPLAMMRSPPIANLNQKFAKEAERQRVVELLANSKTAPAARAVGALVVLHGLRGQELARLQRGDYQPRTRQLRLRLRGLILEVDPVTHDAMEAYLSVRPHARRNPAFFVTRRSQKTGQPATNGFFGGHLKRLGINHGYAFRKTLIRDVVRSENPLVAAKLFGLSREQIERYLSLIAPEKLLQFQRNRAVGAPTDVLDGGKDADQPSLPLRRRAPGRWQPFVL